MSKYKLLLVLVSSFLPAALWAAPTLNVGTVSGQAGTSVSIPITFDPTTASVTGIQFSLTLPASLSTGTVTAGTILINAGKSVATNRVGNVWTFIIFGLNSTSIPSGALLTAQVSIPAGTAVGNLSIPVSGVIYADVNGASVPAGTSTGGTVTVLAPLPVITSAGTSAGQVGVAFSYLINASNSPSSYNATGLPAGLSVNTNTGLISGTPTATGTSTVSLSATNTGGTGTKSLSLTITFSPCDANTDGSTNVFDVQLEVNMALQLTACTKDINVDSRCDVLDIQRIVNAALGGLCVSP